MGIRDRAVGVVSLGATLSRSSWIGIAVAAVVFLALINWKVLPLFLLVGIFCLPLLPDTIYNRILTIGDSRDTSTNYLSLIHIYVPADLPGNLGDVYIAGGGKLPHDVDKAGGGGGFASYPGVRVLRQNSVQDGVGDLVTNLVGVTLSH